MSSIASTTLVDRVILLIRNLDSGYGFFSTLEEWTDISSLRWRNVLRRKQNPTPDMIEALARLWPQYAFWLVTGITDAVNGHVAPPLMQSFPERLNYQEPADKAYFDEQFRLAAMLYQQSGIDMNDEVARMAVSRKVKSELGYIQESPLCDLIVRFVETEDYKAFVEAAKIRENARERKLKSISERRDVKKRTTSGNPVIGSDPRKAHQSVWDLFYLPVFKQE